MTAASPALPDPQEVAGLIAETGRLEIMPRFRALSEDAIFSKGPGDLVTEADRAAERRLTAVLEALLPGSVVVGEEATAADPGVLDRLSHAAPVWVIDPIDGTANYVAGRERFCTIVALVRDGETEAGWIHDPVRNLTAHVRRGEGATLDGRPLAAPEAGGLASVEGRMTLAKRPPAYAEALGRLRDRLGRWGGPATSAGLDYLDVALGSCGLLIFRGTYPWDHAAGALLLQETGGMVQALDGTRYTPVLRRGPLMASASPALWAEARAVIGEAGGLAAG